MCIWTPVSWQASGRGVAALLSGFWLHLSRKDFQCQKWQTAKLDTYDTCESISKGPSRLQRWGRRGRRIRSDFWNFWIRFDDCWRDIGHVFAYVLGRPPARRSRSATGRLTANGVGTAERRGPEAHELTRFDTCDLLMSRDVMKRQMWHEDTKPKTTNLPKPGLRCFRQKNDRYYTDLWEDSTGHFYIRLFDYVFCGVFESFDHFESSSSEALLRCLYRHPSDEPVGPALTLKLKPQPAVTQMQKAATRTVQVYYIVKGSLVEKLSIYGRHRRVKEQ